ncbi:MAG: TonB-dependent receptor [Sphingobium sp.]
MNWRASSGIAIVLAMGTAPSLHAQTAGQTPADQATPSNEIGDIIVTARRVEERLQDIPLAVSAVSGTELQRQSVKDIRDLSATVPNMIIQQGNSDAQSAVVTIRGQSQSNVLLSVDSAVGVYVDNVNNPRSYGLRAGLVDIQRVEVLRGPQGTLYGRNTTGGAVSVFTQDPTPEVGASLQLTAGNYGAFNALGIFSAPIDEGVGVRFVAQYDKHNAYAKAPLSPGSRPNSSDGYYFRGKIKIDSGILKASLTGDIFNYKTGGVATKLTGLVNGTIAAVPGAVAPTVDNPTGAGPVVVLGGLGAREVQLEAGLPFTPAGLAAASALLQSYINKGDFHESWAGSPLGGRGKGGSLAMNIDLALSDYLTLRSISGFRHVYRLSPADNDGTPYLISTQPAGGVTDNFYSQEVQLLGGGEALNWVVGGFYSYENGIETARPQTNFLLGNRNTGINNNTATNSSYAFFGQGNYKITDALTITLGARWTRETKEVINRNSNLSAAGVLTCAITGAAAAAYLDTPGVCQATFKNSFSDPSWLASLKYAFSDDVNVYAKFSRSFRGGGQQLRATGANVATYLPFRPETVTEYEIGLKSQLFDRRVRLNLAAFLDNYSDVQRTINALVGGVGVSLVQNAAKARLWGIEGEADVRVAEGLTFSSAFGYLHPKYLSFADFSGPGATLRDRRNEDWPAPKLNFRVGGRYSIPTSAGDAALDLVYAWQSKQNMQPQGLARDQLTQRAYGLLSGRLSLNIDSLGMEVALFGRNLLDKDYYTAGISIEAVGFNMLEPGDPRTFGIQLTKKFGGI